jgi:hypothetical protein
MFLQELGGGQNLKLRHLLRGFDDVMIRVKQAYQARVDVPHPAVAPMSS